MLQFSCATWQAVIKEDVRKHFFLPRICNSEQDDSHDSITTTVICVHFLLSLSNRTLATRLLPVV